MGVFQRQPISFQMFTQGHYVSYVVSPVNFTVAADVPPFFLGGVGGTCHILGGRQGPHGTWLLFCGLAMMPAATVTHAAQGGKEKKNLQGHKHS